LMVLLVLVIIILLLQMIGMSTGVNLPKLG
jgi:hypothetical protein